MLELKKIRLKHGLKQDDFARELGFTQSYISKVEAGKLNPSYELMVMLRRFCKLNINKLIDEEIENEQVSR